MKICEECNQTAIFIVDESITTLQPCLTGRMLFGEEEVIFMSIHPVNSGNLCYHHMKKQKGLYNGVYRKTK